MSKMVIKRVSMKKYKEISYIKIIIILTLQSWLSTKHKHNKLHNKNNNISLLFHSTHKSIPKILIHLYSFHVQNLLFLKYLTLHFLLKHSINI